MACENKQGNENGRRGFGKGVIGKIPFGIFKSSPTASIFSLQIIITRLVINIIFYFLFNFFIKYEIILL